MTEAEARKLRKKALIEKLLTQMKENERLTEEVAQLRKQLDNKEICINNAGTIAEAAFEMNGVLEAAQAAAQQYLDNVKTLTERQEAECLVKEKAVAARCIAQEQATYERCNHMKEEMEKICKDLEETTRVKCEEREKEAEDRYNELVQKAEQDVEAKWAELSFRLEEFYRAHIGLKSLLTADASIQRN